MAIPHFLNYLFVLFIILLAPNIHGATQIVSKTAGQPWPMPQLYKPTDVIQTLSEFSFRFKVAKYDCTILQSAFERYFKLIFFNHNGPFDTSLKFVPLKYGQNEANPKMLQYLVVSLGNPCEHYPSLGMDESYQLVVDENAASLTSKSIWGALRGLETFSQLIYEVAGGMLMINNTVVEDFPRFAHRGMLLDTSRHFLSVEVIKQNLDAMAYNKLNVFHWHIVDDQSFPYQSRDYPDLSDKGAFNPYSHIYSQQDVADIIEYARFRGIRVVPEFDTPGHSQSWGPGQPGLLTKCYSKGVPNGAFGPIDPMNNSTYTFLKGLMKELTEVFPDKYLHLGGDEVSFACWASNPRIQQFMEAMGFGKKYAKLEEYYMQRLLDIVASLESGYIVWQEVVDNGVKVKPDTVVEVWKGGMKKELEKVTSLGLRTILSSCWYLSGIAFGADWRRYYACEPQAFNGATRHGCRGMEE